MIRHKSDKCDMRVLRVPVTWFLYFCPKIPTYVTCVTCMTYVVLLDPCDPRDMRDMQLSDTKYACHACHTCHVGHMGQIISPQISCHACHRDFVLEFFKKTTKNHVTGTRNTRMSHLAVLNPIMSHI